MHSLDIKVRGRSGKEAVNLGFMLARRHYLPLLMAALPLWALLVVLGAGLWWRLGSPLWLLLMMWWGRPLYERPALLCLSRLMFRQPRDQAAERQAVKAPGLWAELSYLRLFRLSAPIRHAVNCLEGLRGRDRRERLRFFAARSAGGFNLLILMSLLESALFFAALWLIFDVSYRNLGAFLLMLLHQPAELHLLLALFYSLFALLGLPFYIGAGFMIYLNCRIISEGWAVAVDMQRLAQRLSQLVLVLAVAVCLTAGAPAYALSSEEAAADKAWVQAQVQGADGPYGYARLPAERSADAIEWYIPDGDFSQAVRIAVIALSLLFLLWLVYHILRGGGFAASAAKSEQGPAAISIEIQRGAVHSLAAARQAAEEGELLRAVAIVYAHWRQDGAHYRLPVIRSDESEGEYWQRIAGQADAEQVAYLRALFALWQQGAYAQQPLQKAAVVALLERYQRLWRAA